MSNVRPLVDRLAVVVSEFKIVGRDTPPGIIAAWLVDMKDLSAGIAAGLQSNATPAGRWIRSIAEATSITAGNALVSFFRALWDPDASMSVAGNEAAEPMLYAENLVKLYHEHLDDQAGPEN